MKAYKWFRGLLKASALTSVMFVMQACYGMPHDEDALGSYDFDAVDSLQVTGCDDITEVSDFVEETEVNPDEAILP